MSDAGCMTFYKQTIEPIKGMGKYGDWDKFDILERLRPMMQRGWIIDAYTNKIGIANPGISWNSPWWHNRESANKECGLWHQIMFNNWGFIPRGCQECWKVVVRPRTLKELFMLQEVEKKLDRPSKCGIEIRSYTPAHYGGYFYNNSLDAGRECYKVVREAVSDAISPDVGVILKRACTEMELSAGPSPFWKVTKEQVELEEYIEARVDYKMGFQIAQPDYLMNRLYKRWVLWAFSHNDKTYLEYTDGKPLYTPPVVYHEADLGDIKKDLRAARSMGSGVNEAKVLELQQKIDELKKEFGLTIPQFGAALGYTDINPIFAGEEDQMTYKGGAA